MRRLDIRLPGFVVGYVDAYQHRNDGIPYDLFCLQCRDNFTEEELEAMDQMTLTKWGVYIGTVFGVELDFYINEHQYFHPEHKVKALKDPHGTMKW